MERKMTTYAVSMCEDDIRSLKTVVSSKYKKFRKFYRMVEKFSDDIVSLKYVGSDKNTLTVSLQMSKSADIEEMVAYLNGIVDSTDYTCDITTSEKRKVEISLSTT